MARCDVRSKRLLRLGRPLKSEETLDEVVVIRIMAGEAVYPFSRMEILEAWKRLEQMNMSSAEIARRLNVCRKTVHRWRSSQRRLQEAS